MAARQHLILALVAILVSGSVGCAAFRPAPPGGRLSQELSGGDPRYQASQRLVLEGLDADVVGQGERARQRYERALQIDSSNPWAFLALARHHVERGEARRALDYLDRAEALFEAMENDTPGATVHRDGLRGAALVQLGRVAEGRDLLDSAARRAPGPWHDHRLDASELR